MIGAKEDDDAGADDESNDKDQDDEDKAEEEDDVPEVKIDFDGLDQRIIALGVPARAYEDLTAGAEGILEFELRKMI